MQELRRSAVAGRFYASDPDELRRSLIGYLGSSPQPQPAVALMAPHAGYMFSGAIAGQAYARVEVPDRVVILCPNHTGMGHRRSIWTSGSWETPLGNVQVESALAERLAQECQLVVDREAHLREHAIEVQLPFLQARNPQVRIAPICLGRLPLDQCLELGRSLARVVTNYPEPVLLVSSTDMSHYIPAEHAKQFDQLALDRIHALDPVGLYEIVTARDISMCGFIPTTVVLEASKALSATTVEAVAYGTSGDVTGDQRNVVGYASAVVR